MSAEPRDKRLADYNEVLEGLLEMMAAQEETGDGDEDMRELIVDAEEQLRTLAESLNAEETIEVTPGLAKVLLPPTHSTKAGATTAAADDDSSGNAPVMLFPPSDQPRLCAPYEVHYDDREWYPCVITAVVEPAEAVDRRTYKAWILGYNVEETVLSEALRPWGRAQVAERKNAIRSGAPCHAIRPTTGRFEAATVERLTLDGAVLVAFAAAAPSDSTAASAAPATEVVELPLSHVHTGAKFYPALHKRPQLTEAERQERRRETARKKRERAEEEKQRKADKVAQDASDWQALMGDLMGGGGGGAKKRRF